MVTNNYPGATKISKGRDYNFYQKISVIASDFGTNAIDGQQPDVLFTFSAQTIMLLNENTSSTSVVEYSFNGYTVHGELDPTLPSKGLTFDDRSVPCIWFRVKAGSSGPITVRVDAWGIRG